MRRLLLGVLLLCGVAHADPADEVLAESVRLRWGAGVVEAVAVAAADLRAPNVGVARVKAERTAKERALARLTKALRALPASRWERAAPSGEALDQAAQQAEAEPEYESNGSVVLHLRLKLPALPARLLPKHGGKHEPKHEDKAKPEMKPGPKSEREAR